MKLPIRSTSAIPTPPLDEAALAGTTIRDLVDAYPDVMALLAPLGIDLCCGGAHPLGEALDLHGIDRAAVLPKVARLVEGAATRHD